MAAGITIAVALFSELTTAIFTGMILSLALYTLTMADSLKVFALERVSPGIWREVPPPPRLEPGTVTVLEFSGSAYFATTYRASQLLPDHDSTQGAAVVMQMRNRRFYSLTGVDYVLDMIKDLRAHHHVVVLADVDPGQQETLEKTGIAELVGLDNIIWREEIVGRAVDDAYDRATALLSDPRPDRFVAVASLRGCHPGEVIPCRHQSPTLGREALTGCGLRSPGRLSLL